MTFVVVCIELNVSTVVVSLVSVHCQCSFKPFKSTLCVVCASLLLSFVHKASIVQIVECQVYE